MESKEKYYVGLDIGTTKIVAMIGTKNEYGKVKILGVGHAKSFGVHRGTVNNIMQTIQSIQKAVSLAEEASGLNIEEVQVGIAGQHIRSLQHSDYIIRENSEKVINQSDIEKLKSNAYKLGMLPGEGIIHILPQEFKVDDQSEIKDPIGMEGKRLEAVFHVVVGQITSIKNIEKCVTQAGLKCSGLTLEPLASAAAVLSEEEKEAGVALVDIGGGTTDLAIFKDNIIRYTSVIPFGGNIITDDIKEGCSIIEKYAEQLKVQFGSTWPAENKDNEIVAIPGLRGREPKEISLKNLSMIIYARMVEIIRAVFNEIKKYGYDEQKKKLIGGIVLTGGGSELKHIRQLVEYETGLDTRIGYPNEHLAGNSDEKMRSPIFATSIGLLMNAIEAGEKKEKNSVENKAEEAIIKNQQSIEIIEDENFSSEIEKEDETKEKKGGFINKFFSSFKNLIDESSEQ